jgi:hypothetical protein
LRYINLKELKIDFDTFSGFIKLFEQD